VLASDHSLAGQLRRSTALGPIEILLGIITFATALGEGAANERLTLMLVDNRGVPPVGALTFAGDERDDGYRSISGGVVIQRYGRAPVLRAAGVLACTGVGRDVFSKSTLIALLGALADGDALENIPSKNPTDIFALS